MRGLVDRYVATGPEAEFEPGSRRRVLRNLLGIRSVREMEKVESAELLSSALAIVHAELVLIHPFRDGNRRCARLVATLMALQADLPPLDFSGVRGRERKCYFEAVHAAMAGDSGPMIAVFDRIITRTLEEQRS